MVDKEGFLKDISDKLSVNTSYNYYLKIRYDKDIYRMCLYQTNLFDKSTFNLELMYWDLKSKIDYILNKYNWIASKIVHFTVTFVPVRAGVIAEFKLDTELKNNNLGNNEFDIDRLYSETKYLPITTNFDRILKEVDYTTNKGIINDIPVTFAIGEEGQKVNFLNFIHSQNTSLIHKTKNSLNDFPKEFDSKWKFYVTQGYRVPYVICYRYDDKDTNTVLKMRFSAMGSLLDNVKDVAYNNTLTRYHNNYSIKLDNNIITNVKSNIKLYPIKRKRDKTLSFVENDKIGVIDFEAIKCYDSKQRFYCGGFRSWLEKEPIIFYVDTDKFNGSNYQVFDEMVVKLRNKLFESKYKSTIFYCHNLGGYDFVFVLGVLLRTKNEKNLNLFDFDVIYRDSNALKVTIYALCEDDSGNMIRKNKITICDSLAILPASQKVLCEDFEVNTQKGVLPYLFLHQDNLGYIGHTPEIGFYENVSQEEYKTLIKNDWSFEKESKIYLTNDINGLYEVITKASKSYFLKYGVDITKGLTVASNAMTLYLSKYYKDNIPLVNDMQMYKDIKEAYYGGITEVYKPYGQNLFYYDVNSLYPFVGYKPMPGLEAYKEEYFSQININDLFGFYYCEIYCDSNRYLGLLPVRQQGQGNIYPTGKWFGWYFSEELKFASKNGYSIKILKGYSFNKELDVFKEYINEVYQNKANATNSTEKSMAKSLLNNLLGRFGISLEKSVTKIVARDQFEEMLSFHKIKSVQELGNEYVLIEYVPRLDYDIIDANKMDITKVIEKKGDYEGVKMNYTSIPISAAINAYARIYISQIKLHILQNKGNIYYSDTDSIVTDIELPSELVDPKHIGKFKLEHLVAKGIFTSSKTYCLLTKDGKFISKAKGVKINSLSWFDYFDHLCGNDISAMKKSSYKNLEEGFVDIKTDPITLHSDSYKGRIKKYKNGYWYDTIPLQINNVDSPNIEDKNHNRSLVIENDKSLIIYKIDNYLNMLRGSILPLNNNVFDIQNYNDRTSKFSFKNVGILYDSSPNLIESSNKEFTNKISKEKISNSIKNKILLLPALILLPICFIAYLYVKFEDEFTQDHNEYTDEIDIEDKITNLNDLYLDKIELPISDKNVSIWERLFGNSDIKKKDYSNKIDIERLSSVLENNSYDNIDVIWNDLNHEILDKVSRENKKFNTFDDLLIYTIEYLNRNGYSGVKIENITNKLYDIRYDLEHIKLIVDNVNKVDKNTDSLNVEISHYTDNPSDSSNISSPNSDNSSPRSTTSFSTNITKFSSNDSDRDSVDSGKTIKAVSKDTSDSTSSSEDISVSTSSSQLHSEKSPTEKPQTLQTTTSPDLSADMFSPNTLKELELEIAKNKDNLDKVNSGINKDLILEERKYFLDQKGKHLNGLLQQAKNTHINEVDLNKLFDDISKFKTDTDSLVEKAKDLKDRRL